MINEEFHDSHNGGKTLWSPKAKSRGKQRERRNLWTTTTSTRFQVPVICCLSVWTEPYEVYSLIVYDNDKFPYPSRNSAKLYNAMCFSALSGSSRGAAPPLFL